MKNIILFLIASTLISSFARSSDSSNNHSLLENVFNESKFNSESAIQEHLGVYVGECFSKITFQNEKPTYTQPVPVFMVLAFFKMPKINVYRLFPWNYSIKFWSNKPVEDYVNKYFDSIFINTQKIINGEPVYGRTEGVESLGVVNNSFVTKIGARYYTKHHFFRNDEKIITQKNFITSFRMTHNQSLVSKIEYEDFEISHKQSNVVSFCSWYKIVKNCSDLPAKNRGANECEN